MVFSIMDFIETDSIIIDYRMEFGAMDLIQGNQLPVSDPRWQHVLQLLISQKSQNS
jgi:hypothetical protein